MKQQTKLTSFVTVIAAIMSISTLLAAPQVFSKEKSKKMTIQTPPAQTTPPPTTQSAIPVYKFETGSTLEKFEDVTLVKSRTLKADSQSTELQSVSFGLRKKAVFGLVPVRVYVAQFFAAHPEKLVHSEEGFLNSLKSAGPVQLQLTFLRDLPGTKVSESFKEGLEANGLKLKNLTPEISEAMNAVAAISEFKKNESFSVTAVWTENTSSLILESAKENKVITGSSDLAGHVLAIWFGKPADGKLADLKKKLIQ